MAIGKYLRRQWPEEVVEYIKANASMELKINEMWEMVNKQFGTSYTRDQIKGQYVRNHLPFASGIRHNLLLTDEQAEYLAGIILGRSSAECRDMINSKYGLSLTLAQIRSWKKNHKVSSGYDTRYRKGEKPWITGRKFPGRTNTGSFTAGHIADNNLPIGSERIHAGYLYVKVQDGEGNANWKRKAHVVYEQIHGELPEGMKIVTLDRNPNNTDPDNLLLITAEEHALANMQYGLAEDPEINRSVYTLAKLKSAIRKRKNG